jgi:lipid-A-disaccharide synthase-like uncharacterized protein
MNTNKIIPISFIISYLFTIVGALLKIMHWPNANVFLIIGMLALAFFVGTCIYEIMSSERINKSEKIMWFFGFLFFWMITGLVYILLGRKRIIRRRINQQIKTIN